MLAESSCVGLALDPCEARHHGRELLEVALGDVEVAEAEAVAGALPNPAELVAVASSSSLVTLVAPRRSMRALGRSMGMPRPRARRRRPAPMPISTLPPNSRSSVANSLASTAGWWS